MQRFSCAVLGATGVVGQKFLSLLDAHPDFELTAVCASEARTGQRLGDAQEIFPDSIPRQFANITFEPMDVDILLDKGVQIVFSALPASIAREFEMDAAEKGLYVFSNAGAFRMHPQVPILIPEVNQQHLDLVKVQQKRTPGFIVTNANCTTTGLVLALLPFVDLRIKKIIVSTYQAMSGAGYPGLSVLDMNANVIPYISGEEEKVMAESGKILGLLTDGAITPVDWQVYSHCVRVPTITGHLLSVHLEVEKETSKERIMESLNSYQPPASVLDCPTAPHKPILYHQDSMRPQPRFDIMAGEPDRSRGMAITIGRLSVSGPVIRFITLSNNLIRGAAGGSVLNAELALRKNFL